MIRFAIVIVAVVVADPGSAVQTTTTPDEWTAQLSGFDAVLMQAESHVGDSMQWREEVFVQRRPFVFSTSWTSPSGVVRAAQSSDTLLVDQNEFDSWSPANQAAPMSEFARFVLTDFSGRQVSDYTWQFMNSFVEPRSREDRASSSPRLLLQLGDDSISLHMSIDRTEDLSTRLLNLAAWLRIDLGDWAPCANKGCIENIHVKIQAVHSVFDRVDNVVEELREQIGPIPATDWPLKFSEQDHIERGDGSLLKLADPTRASVIYFWPPPFSDAAVHHRVESYLSALANRRENVRFLSVCSEVHDPYFAHLLDLYDQQHEYCTPVLGDVRLGNRPTPGQWRGLLFVIDEAGVVRMMDKMFWVTGVVPTSDIEASLGPAQ